MQSKRQNFARIPQSGLQQAVELLLKQAVADGAEKAIQMAVYFQGTLIVDAWAAPSGWRVNGETLFPSFSTGKGIAATAIHRLVERRVLSWDEPIARYWPEFEGHGKGGITLRHVLNHTAGVPQLPSSEVMADPCNWDGICHAIAQMKPLHPPGAQQHYHAVTFSWLLGEPARRAVGRDFASIIIDEVCRPLGMRGIFFGLTDAEMPRAIDAEAMPPQPSNAPASSSDPISEAAIPPWIKPLETWINRSDVRRACIPASNGFMNARSIARHYAALLNHGVDGVRLLESATVETATQASPVPTDPDGAAGWGLGYALQGPADAPGAVFGHGGYGGSIGFADTRRGLAVGGVKSLMGGSATFEAALQVVHRQIGI